MPGKKTQNDKICKDLSKIIHDKKSCQIFTNISSITGDCRFAPIPGYPTKRLFQSQIYPLLMPRRRCITLCLPMYRGRQDPVHGAPLPPSTAQKTRIGPRRDPIRGGCKKFLCFEVYFVGLYYAVVVKLHYGFACARFRLDNLDFHFGIVRRCGHFGSSLLVS